MPIIVFLLCFPSKHRESVSVFSPLSKIQQPYHSIIKSTSDEISPNVSRTVLRSLRQIIASQHPLKKGSINTKKRNLRICRHCPYCPPRIHPFGPGPNIAQKRKIMNRNESGNKMLQALTEGRDGGLARPLWGAIHVEKTTKKI